jgi:hypothetical protein
MKNAAFVKNQINLLCHAKDHVKNHFAINALQNIELNPK